MSQIAVTTRPQLRVALDHLVHGRHVDARRRPAEQTFLAGETPGRHERLVGRDGDDAVHRGQVEVRRHDAVGDAGHAVGAPRVIGDQRTLGRLDREREHRRVALLQRVRDPADPPARALRADHGVDATPGLLPDLLAARELRLGVVGVLELPRKEVAVGIGGHDLTHAFDREVDVGARAGREHEVGAVGADHRLALVAHALGHHDHAPVPLDRRDRRARDAGVAGRALDDRHAGLEVASLLGLGEHRGVDAVLHRARRSVPLDLREHLDAGRGHALQTARAASVRSRRAGSGSRCGGRPTRSALQGRSCRTHTARTPRST